VLEDDTPELAAEEAIKGETLKIQGALIETTTTDSERAQEGDSGEVDRRKKRSATRRHARRRGGGCRSLRRRVRTPMAAISTALESPGRDEQNRLVVGRNCSSGGGGGGGGDGGDSDDGRSGGGTVAVVN